MGWLTLLPLALLPALIVAPGITASSTGGGERNASRSAVAATSIGLTSFDLSILDSARSLEKCPPCFNCLLPAFTCGQYGDCDPYDGQCKCPPGWGGIDCLTPQCDSLADGDERHLREEGKQCECKDGWSGINCNVCKSDNACKGFPLAGGVASSLTEGEDTIANMTCYTGGQTIFANHQFCDVTNRKIVDMLPDRPPQVTFSCDAPAGTCDFQFWTAQVESFYCALDTCQTEVRAGIESNTTLYSCEKIKCSCVPDRFICGEDGSVDISDFLTEEIKGPATFSCKTGAGCKFEEPAMNQLINDIFGDGYITLECEGGECLHYSQVPGYIKPVKPDNTQWVALSIAGAGFFVVLTSAILWYAGRTRQSDFGAIRLPEDEAARLMTDHVPAALHFSDLRYTLNGSSTASATGGPSGGGRVVLDNIQGIARPGQVTAIMGASGAGKSTLLDLLARKRKRGAVSGTALVNGRVLDDDDAFRDVVGFVDQEDTLMGTLTVYETVLNSALLRLPREMGMEAKRYRTLETMSELGILGIKDVRVGDSGRRSISGGEKRRVSIACELVTSPSILFLDEPTSGLDAYNAFNVVESLVTLAREYNRTVVFTIHQPRSNIVALFDQLILLAQGKLVYSGAMAKCHAYFSEIGHPCPPGFNIADFLIDLTMQADPESHSTEGSSTTTSTMAAPSSAGDAPFRDEERGLLTPTTARPFAGAAEDATEPQVQQHPTSDAASDGFLKRKTSQLLEAVSFTSSHGPGDAPLSPRLATLVDAYAASAVAAAMKSEIEDVAQARGGEDAGGEMRDVVVESGLLRGRKRASWTTQFGILSGRAFKNLYRDPALLTAHYTASIALALICGLFYQNVSNDIGGFQNRLGAFFFMLALFGFSCLSSVGLFANERILFMRERSNGYYSSFTYFSSKVLFDILPLRIVPPMLFGGIVYGLVGFVPTVAAFWKFLLTLVLFNLTTASAVLLIAVACESTSVANFAGTLVMLFNLLFTGLLINRSKVHPLLQWLHTISFFHAAFEALSVNELRYLQLKEIQYGVEIDVPAATILSIFGLRAQSFWWPNIALLSIFFVAFTFLSYLVLHFHVREKR